MSSCLLVGDVHLSDKPPSSRTATYTQDILDKLQFCVEKANELDVPIAQGGDLFHVKSASKNSHRLVQQTHEVLKETKNGVWIVPGNHDLCVSEDTEALTRRGWKKHTELIEHEEIATLNPVTHAFEWQSVTTLYQSKYKGEMCQFKSRGVDHLVTPNHKMYVKTKNWGWQFRNANDAPNYQYWEAKVSSDAWKGAASSVTIPASARKPAYEITDLNSLASLLGWYVAEGCVERWRVTICQDAEKNAANCEEIKNLCDALQLPWTQSAKYIRINCGRFATFIQTHFAGTSYHKFLPAWIKDWPTKLLCLLLQAYLAGDATKNGPNGFTATTASDILAGDLQEICVKIGWSANVAERKNYPVTIPGQNYVGTGRRIGIYKKASRLLMGMTKIDYEGVVWCPTVDNHIWLSRRNGVVLWTGNSHDRLDSLDSQPLGALGRMSNITILMGYDSDLPGILGQPYLSSFDGGNWQQEMYDWQCEYVRRNAYKESDLIVTHSPIFPSGKAPGVYSSITPFEWVDWWGTEYGMPKHTFYSHIHDCHGVYEEYGHTFCNQGALSRGSLHESSINRKPAITFWDGANFTRIEVPHKAPEEVFLFEQASIKANNQASATEFADALGKVSLTNLTIEEVLASLRAEVYDDNVMKTIERVLEDVQ